MAKLSFLDENELGEETEQSFVPKLSKFKTRKREFKNLSSNNNTSNKSTINKRYLSFDEDDDSVDDIKSLTSNVYKPKENANLENNIYSDNTVKEIPDTKSEKNIQDYLNSYGDTSFMFNKETSNQITKNKSKEDADGDEVMSNDISYKVSDNEIEGFIIEGSDLEDDNETENFKEHNDIIRTKNINNNYDENETCLTELNTQKLNAKRRKEIEDALLTTSLNDLSNSEESDDEKISLVTRSNDHDKNNTYVLDFDINNNNNNNNNNNDDIDESNLSVDGTDKLKSERCKSEVRFVCYNVNPLVDQLNSTNEKLKTIHNIVTKRDIQINHLESEYEKINFKGKEYMEKLKNSFHNLQ